MLCGIGCAGPSTYKQVVEEELEVLCARFRVSGLRYHSIPKVRLTIWQTNSGGINVT
jgi:hypothetical protein